MKRNVISLKLANKAKQALLKLKSNGTTANKLKALIAANKHGIKKVAEVFDVGRTSIYRWADELDKEGLNKMINNSKHQDGIKLKKNHKEKIRSWIEKDHNISIAAVKENLEKQFNLRVSRSTVHRAMKEAGFSYITPRKIHYKQDKKATEDFKRKSSK
jgi:transposase